jgi:hypothetical protein
MFIPDPDFFHPGSRILDPGSASKNLSFLPQKIVSILSEIWSGLFLPDPDPDFFYPSRILFFLPIPDPGSRIQGSKGHRIRIRNTDSCLSIFNSFCVRPIKSVSTHHFSCKYSKECLRWPSGQYVRVPYLYSHLFFFGGGGGGEGGSLISYQCQSRVRPWVRSQLPPSQW